MRNWNSPLFWGDIGICCTNFDSTYEELKPIHLSLPKRPDVPDFDSTYEELKLSNIAMFAHLQDHFDSTYEELKPVEVNEVACEKLLHFDSTYEELKHFAGFVTGYW